MEMSEELHVWYQDVLVGILWRDQDGRIGFRYSTMWRSDGFPISQQLPLSIEEYPASQGVAHRFFANLLPEADARMHIVRDLKISNSDFALLKAVGGECAGALSILPQDCRPENRPSYKKLSKREIGKIIRRRGSLVNLTTEEDRPRLSLAGAQDKCPLLIDEEGYFLPEEASPSTHLLKFEVTGYSHVPAYEYFLTEVAGAVGMPVVQSAFKKHDDTFYLAVKRYDRKRSEGGGVCRLHQEDFCQALGVSHESKYQKEGGPSFGDCYSLLKKASTNPLVDCENLLRWMVFNLLAGNSDGHAKNLSLLYDKDFETRLAPFYDLVCTRAIERIDVNLAMSIGGEYNPGRVTWKHWSSLAKSCGLRDRFMVKLIHEMVDRLPSAVIEVRKQFESRYGAYPALQRVESVVNKQCKRFVTLST